MRERVLKFGDDACIDLEDIAGKRVGFMNSSPRE